MSENPSVFESSTMKRITAMRDQQRRIIAEIEEIKRESNLRQAESSRIYNLREEYNSLVDKQEEMNRRPSPDPLEVLPPELWPDIMPENIGELLVLSMVCTRWRDILFSIPKLWSTIDLNGTRQDYLAEAIVCFALSEPLEINLTISLPLKEWKNVAPLVVAEHCRIARLTISPICAPLSQTEGLEILSDFIKLEKLASLRLPGLYYDPFLFPFDSISRHKIQNWYSGDETLFSKAPLLRDISGSVFTTEQLHMSGITQLKSVSTYGRFQDAVKALECFPKLETLHLTEEKEPEGVDISLPKSFDGCLSSIMTLFYHGITPNRAIRCAGSSLTDLEVRCVSPSQLPEIIVSLHLFPRLCKLALYVDVESRKFNIKIIEAISLPSIKYLTLHFLQSFIFGPRGDNNNDDGHTISAERYSQGVDGFFRSLIAIIPNVEELELHGQGYREAAIEYIQSLRKLRILHFALDINGTEIPRLVLSCDQLETVKWYGQEPPDGLLHVVQSSTLRMLYLWSFDFAPFDSLTEPLGCQPATLPHSKPLSTPFSNLRSLTLKVERHVTWDLNMFPRLEEIILSGDPSGFLAGDFLVELLLQPDLCPFLEAIGINGHFVEWDLMILMLERRNFVVRPETTRIKKVQQYASDISYKLLYPISKLLQGKYPRRDSIAAFSTIAMGRLIWDPST